MSEMPQQKDLFTKHWRTVRDDPAEAQLQIALVEHLRWRAKPDVIYFHVPNGGLRNKAEAAKLKAMGTLPGVSDLIFVWYDYDKHDLRNLYLELKARGRRPSPAQHNFAAVIGAAGADYAWTDDLDTALLILKQHGLLKS
jgi:hypothetical protein